MKRKTMAFIALAALCAVLLTGCHTATTPDFPQLAEKRTISSRITDKTVQTMANQGELSLQLDVATGEFWVEDMTTGFCWRSNPSLQDREADPIAKGSARSLLASALRVEYKDGLGNISTAASYTASVKKGGLTLHTIENGFRAVYTFVDEKLTIPLDVQLTEDGLRCRVPVTEIIEEGNAAILSVEVLPAFGAAGENEEGYILVPDGSGALVNLHNGKYLYDDLSLPCFGEELSRQINAKTYEHEQVLLPVFGIRRGDQALLAIISEAAAEATIGVTVAEKKSNYDTVSAKFTLRNVDRYTIGASVGTTKEVSIFQKEINDIAEIGLTYRFIRGEQANYVGMAASCREWMLKNGWLNPQKRDFSPLYLRFLGGALKEKSVMGIPKKVIEKLTDFSYISDTLQVLRQNEINNSIVLLEGWSSAALKGKIDTAAAPASQLGGKKEFWALLDQCARQNTTLYLNTEFTRAAHWSSGYSSFFHSAKTVGGVPAQANVFDVASHLPIDDRAENLLSPSIFYDVFFRFSDNLQKAVAGRHYGLNLGKSASTVYGDFKKGYCRDKSERAIQAIAQSIQQSGTPLLGYEANAYLWAYSDAIPALPMNASRYNVEDCEIPFLQIVLKGYVPYSTFSINQASDTRTAFLQAVETGSGLLFTWIGEDASATKDLCYAEYTSAMAEDWMDTAVQYAKDLMELSNQTENGIIVAHARWRDMAMTQYENGTTVYVNYGTENAVWNEVAVPAGGYAVKCTP